MMMFADAMWLASKAVVFGGVLVLAGYVLKSGFSAERCGKKPRGATGDKPRVQMPRPGPVPPHMRGYHRNMARGSESVLRTQANEFEAQMDEFGSRHEVPGMAMGPFGISSDGTLTPLHMPGAQGLAVSVYEPIGVGVQHCG